MRSPRPPRRTRRASAAADRLDEMLAEQKRRPPTCTSAPPTCCAAGTPAGATAAWERLGRDDDEIGESPASAFRRLRLEMLAAERDVVHRRARRGPDRRRGAAVGAARARPRGSDAQPGLESEFTAERPHRIDHRSEHPMCGGQILVG